MTEGAKNKIKKLVDAINRFVQSDWFLILNGIIVLIGWGCKIWVPMLCVLFAISIVPLFLGKGTKHLLGTLMTFTLIISTNRHSLNDFAWLLALIPVLLVGIIFNLIRFRRSTAALHPTKIKGFHLSLIALVIPFALAGVGSATENVYAILAALGLVVVVALCYTFFVVTNYDDENKKDLIEYVVKTLAIMGVIISIQMTVLFVNMGSFDKVIEACCTKQGIEIGWAGPNNIGPILAMCIPATLYLCIRKNKFTPVFATLAIIEYMFIICTGSRGSILVVTATLVPMLLYVMSKTENKILFGATISIIALVLLVLAAFYGDKVAPIITTLLNKGLASAGRTDGLYPEAIGLFKQHPIFGVGWDYKLGGLTSDNYTPYYFHSTALQILATMGICGVIAFVFFFFFRYRNFLVLRKNPAVLALMISTLCFDAYGMVDTCFFSPTFLIMTLVMTLAVEVNLPENKCRAFGGRNPFVDIANLAKACVAKIKSKHKKEVAVDVVADGADNTMSANAENDGNR